MTTMKQLTHSILLVGVCLGFTITHAGSSSAQQLYPTAEKAADAFVDALATSDADALRVVLGSDWRRFIPTDGVDADDKLAFLGAWAKKHEIVQDSDELAHLSVGKGGWTLPIPIVRKGDEWRFDTRGAADEILTRRIGENELSAIQASLAYRDAQIEYAELDHNGDGVPEYAQRILSTPGKQDGLYWAALPGEAESPLGPGFGTGRKGDGYHGYHFRILKAQGANARGGAYDYMIGGRMRGGFALVAWPIDYDETGVMTFIVNHEGTVYQKDLGPKTASLVGSIKSFDPDSTWSEVEP